MHVHNVLKIMYYYNNIKHVNKYKLYLIVKNIYMLINVKNVKIIII